MLYRQESFNFIAGPSQPKLFAWIFDYKTLGKDKLLASGEVDVSPPWLMTLSSMLTMCYRFGGMFSLACHLLPIL